MAANMEHDGLLCHYRLDFLKVGDLSSNGESSSCLFDHLPDLVELFLG
jgi:hypothetical protein